MKTSAALSSVTRRRFIGNMVIGSGALLLPDWSRAIEPPLPSKKIGVALAGLGGYSTHQLGPALRQTKRCRLAGVVTGDRAKGKEWAHDYGFPEKNIFSYDTMGRLAESPDIDVVYVVTPNGLHAEHTIAAAKSGKHVICEKPMAISVAECDAMIAACKSAGVRLMIGYRLHFEPNTIELTRLAHDKDLGIFMRIDAANGFRMRSPKSAGNWRADKKLAGGGPLMDMGVYVIQAACMAKVEAAPVSIRASFGPVTRPEIFSEIEESVKWEAEFSDGAKASCLATYAENVSRFRVESDTGWAQLGPPAFYYDTPVLTTSRGRVRKPSVNQQAAQLDGMALELLTGSPSLAPGEMGRRDLAIIEAIYAAAKSGERTLVKA
ncbi:MAG: Gfo/Idh/MocA family oxidoreductase [Nibricoccus sp.]